MAKKIIVDIRPKKSVGDVRFGMTKEMVKKTLENKQKALKDDLDLTFVYSISYNNNRVSSIDVDGDDNVIIKVFGVPIYPNKFESTVNIIKKKDPDAKVSGNQIKSSQFGFLVYGNKKGETTGVSCWEKEDDMYESTDTIVMAKLGISSDTDMVPSYKASIISEKIGRIMAFGDAIFLNQSSLIWINSIDERYINRYLKDNQVISFDIDSNNLMMLKAELGAKILTIMDTVKDTTKYVVAIPHKDEPDQYETMLLFMIEGYDCVYGLSLTSSGYNDTRIVWEIKPSMNQYDMRLKKYI